MQTDPGDAGPCRVQKAPQEPIANTITTSTSQVQSLSARFHQWGGAFQPISKFLSRNSSPATGYSAQDGRQRVAGGKRRVFQRRAAPGRQLHLNEPRQGRKTMCAIGFFRPSGAPGCAMSRRGLRATRLPPATVCGPSGAEILRADCAAREFLDRNELVREGRPGSKDRRALASPARGQRQGVDSIDSNIHVRGYYTKTGQPPFNLRPLRFHAECAGSC